MKNVVILQYRLLHYRIELFELMRDNLLQKGICLHLVHGDASLFEAKRKDEGSLSWAHKVKNHFLRLGGVDLIWQPLPDIFNKCDLLIFMQENRILSNYPQILKRKLSPGKIAYWGHGKNLQSKSPKGVREIWKKYWLTRVDWWFAYTVSTKEYLIERSFPEDSITCLNNAIDVNKFNRELDSISEKNIEDIEVELKIPSTAIIGLYCGSLYAEKRLDLMLDAVDKIRTQIDDFYVIVIGDGPYAQFLQKASLSRPWLILVGVKKGEKKALYYRLSNIVLNPGLVGLHILDSFCAGIPMVTTRDALHSPEFDYIEDGINGLVTEGTSGAYSSAIIELLSNNEKLDEMRNACHRDSQKYTVEAMAGNFCDGILKCINKE